VRLDAVDEETARTSADARVAERRPSRRSRPVELSTACETDHARIARTANVIGGVAGQPGRRRDTVGRSRLTVEQTREPLGRVRSFRLRRGTWIDGYEIRERLGRGWEGEVYRAREKYSRGQRVLKLFDPALYRSTWMHRYGAKLERLSSDALRVDAGIRLEAIDRAARAP
jgi:hypothetical protein